MSDTVTRQPRDQRPDGPQLYASRRRVAIRATDADGRRTASFAVYDVDHDATTNLPDLPGLIRLEGDDDSELVLVHNLRAWVETHRTELQAAAPRGLSCRLLWGCPEPAALEGIYRASRGTLGALRTGRPTAVTALRDAPNGWGLYRITKPSGEIYVGISSNVRNRLYAHQGAGRLHLSAGDTVEALSARQPGAGGVVTWADLQEAERFHIRKLRGRGHTLINIVGGGNGMPPGSRFNVPDDDGVELANPSQVAPRLTWSTALEWNQGQRAETEHQVPVVALHTTYARATGDWDLQLALDPDQQVWAQPPGTGEAHEIDPGRITWIQPDILRRLYAAPVSWSEPRH